MSIHYLATDLIFTCTDPASNTDENFDAFTDELADQLEALAEVDPGIIDPDLTVRVADRWASPLMGIEADTPDDAVRLFSANLRAALHATGAATADWPTFVLVSAPDVQRAEFVG